MQRTKIDLRGIPHLAKNERDVGRRDLWQIRKVIKRLRSTGVRFQGREGKSPAGQILLQLFHIFK